jgi:hypothetical protein
MSARAFNPARYLPSAAYKKAGILVVNDHLQGTAPATAGNYGQFFIAPYKCVVLSVDASWGVASASGTLQVEKLPSGTAIDSGTDLLSSTIDTSATANTPVSGTLVTTAASVQLALGDRLGLSDGGTLTNSADVVVTVVLAPIN